MKKIISILSLSFLTACGLQVRDNPTFTGGNPSTNNPNATYTVGGQAIGIPVGKSVTVRVHANEYPINENGTFTFPINFTPGSPYNVNVVTGPGGAYSCTLENDEGVIANANVTNVLLNCSCAVGSLGAGAGTTANPYFVYTADQWNGVAVAAVTSSFNKEYKQVCDLDYGDILPTPVGSVSNPFRGVYDGNGFYILNYTSNDSTAALDRMKGVFGYTLGAWLKNINLKDFNLTATAGMGNTTNPAHMGSLVATAHDTYIDHIYGQNLTLNNNGNYFHGLGGLIGNQPHSTNSGTTNVTGLEFVHLENVDIVGGISNKVGGVVGWTDVDSKKIEIAESHIHSCAYRCGGVVGAIFNKASFIDVNALNVTVEGDEATGGITGESIGVINRAAFIGTVNGKTTAGGFGGIIGRGNGFDPTSNSYTVSDILSVPGTTAAGRINGSTALITNIGYDNTQTCQNCTVNSGIGYAGDSVFKTGSHVSQNSWNFTTTWCINPGFPRLAVVPNAICEEIEP